jgi:methylmalonyl-CoA/ethylmalonyl-CoA epimerase
VAVIIEHIGIAVRSLEEALRMYTGGLGLDAGAPEEVPDQGVRLAMLPIGESRIELLEPTGPDSPVEKFLARRGPGIHHIAIRVDDLDGALERMRRAGARLIDETPRRGAGDTRVAFVHPASMHGVLLELVEHEK